MSEWLNLEQAAEYLGDMKIATLRGLVRNKKIAHSGPPRHLAFKSEWLDEYMEAHKVPVVENRFGLTDQALNNILTDRSTRGRKAS